MLKSIPTVDYKSSTAGRRRRWLAMVSSVALVLVATSPSLDFEGAVSRLLADAATNTTEIASSKPNMLLLVLDQWRYDWDGMTPDTPTGPLPLKMPFLESAAKKGVRFTQAYVPAPLCGPVRACLASGKEYDECGVLVNHVDDWPVAQDTFYKLMRDQSDYDVFSCGKDDLFKDDKNFPFYSNLGGHASVDLGFTNAMRSAGKHRVTKEHAPYERFRTFLEQSEVGNETKASAYDVYKQCFDGPTGPDGAWSTDSLCSADKFTSEIYPDDFVQREAVSLIANSKKDKPWFMQVNFPGPHAPMMSTAEMAASVSGRTWPSPHDSAYKHMLQCPQVKGVNDDVPHMGGRCNYAAELENLDKLMHNIFKYLTTVKLIDNTIICMVGDHGEMLGDHEIMGKKVPWQASISVPLVCFGPGIKEGVVYKDPVTTLDLAGTFMDFAGAKPNDDMTTKSLKPFMTEGTTPPREFVSSGLFKWRLVVQVVDDVSYKLICCKGDCGQSPTTVPPPIGGWQLLLYDTQADRFDMSPIEDKPDVVEKLRQNLPDGWCTDAKISVKAT
eukprot:CAMPEP_0119005746 /NCGR_PEP_ID=MMETSP1176-20130426/1905_1 /TAXON_ID=265551 /ORGANISM="Synedropsis recta cf, Strain CCMP1620" /LENGTH=554 /DNA_ID=CAMNT_0006957587 /DNA_START=55 /DNA_END=1719 /DNA_ORIENTATION=-